jgi:predicted MFS family arabinose efflux permease
MATFAFANFEGTVAVFLKEKLDFTLKQVLLLFAYIGFVLMVAQGGVYRYLARKGMEELTFIKIGLVLLMVGMAGLGGISLVAQYPEATSPAGIVTSVLLALAIAVFGFAFLTPSVQALISRRSDPTKQGEILGVNQSASALARILGPLIGLSLTTVPPTYFWPYVVATTLLAGVLALAPRLK